VPPSQAKSNYNENTLQHDLLLDKVSADPCDGRRNNSWKTDLQVTGVTGAPSAISLRGDGAFEGFDI
jgi:hypothetical protein